MPVYGSFWHKTGCSPTTPSIGSCGSRLPPSPASWPVGLLLLARPIWLLWSRAIAIAALRSLLLHL
eukprot:10018302-Heterocapsa_arctica.AAC.1